MRRSGLRFLWGGVVGVLAACCLTSWFEVYVFEAWWSRVLGDVLEAPFLGMALIGLYLIHEDRDDRRKEQQRYERDYEAGER